MLTDNNAQTFMVLAGIALRDGYTADAAQLMTQATRMSDFNEYLAEGLSGNYQAQTWVDSLSKSDLDFNSLSSEFQNELKKAFSGIANDDEDEEDEDSDYDLGVGTDSDDEDDELESESATSNSPLSFRI